MTKFCWFSRVSSQSGETTGLCDVTTHVEFEVERRRPLQRVVDLACLRDSPESRDLPVRGADPDGHGDADPADALGVLGRLILQRHGDLAHGDVLVPREIDQGAHHACSQTTQEQFGGSEAVPGAAVGRCVVHDCFYVARPDGESPPFDLLDIYPHLPPSTVDACHSVACNRDAIASVPEREVKMRAAVLRTFGDAPRVEDVATPEPGPGEARVRVGACGVDRFDVEIAAGKRPRARVPLILGHEIAGEISAVHDGVVSWQPGHRVVASLYLVCGTCDRCVSGRETICQEFGGHVGLDIAGGYAEEMVLPARNLVRLPDKIGFEQGALVANVIGTSVHALQERMRLRPGERLIITGAGGGVGLHAVQVARYLGAEVMAVDVSEARLQRARELGAARVHHTEDGSVTEAAREWTGGVGVDAVLELVGPATMSETLPSLTKGGRLVVVGSHSGSVWEVDPHEIYRNEWEIIGSRNVSVREIVRTVRLVLDGHVTPIVDQAFGLDEVDRAFERLLAGAVIGRDVLVP